MSNENQIAALEQKVTIRWIWAGITFIGALLVPVAGYFFGELIPGIEPMPIDSYWRYPPVDAPPRPGFDMPLFMLTTGVASMMFLPFCFPRLFGFQRKPAAPVISSASFPFWFYLGIGLMISSGTVLFTHLNPDTNWIVWLLARYGYIPFMLGYTLITDGIAYRLNDKRSPISQSWVTLLLVTIVSAVSWTIYGFANYLEGFMWTAPFAKQISNTAFLVYSGIGAATLVPGCVTTMAMLGANGHLVVRWSSGPLVCWSKTFRITLLVMVQLVWFFSSWFWQISFPMFLIGPVLSLLLILDLNGIWTPFRSIKINGNWSLIMLAALAEFLMGLVFEVMNGLSRNPSQLVHFGSSDSVAFSSYVPGFWQYNLAYIDGYKIGELPIPGFSGYLVYGIFNFALYGLVYRLMKFFRNRHEGVTNGYGWLLSGTTAGQ